MRRIASITLVTLPLLLVLMGRSAALSPPLDFGIDCTQDTLRTRPGGQPVRFQMSLIANGYQGPVRLACVALNPHLRCEASSPSVTLSGDSVVPFVVMAWADPAAKAPVAYTLILIATGGSSSRTDTLHLVVSGQ